MTTDIQVQFSTHDGEKDYVQAVAGLIRAEQHDLAEDTLIASLASLHVPLAELCLETRTNLVELTHWDTLQQMIFRPLESGALCTAVGLDLSNYSKQMTAAEGVEPIVEVAFYSDDIFPFSAKNREEILAENATPTVPWHGCFEPIEGFGDFVMDVVGLARLNSAVKLDEARRYARPWPGPPVPAPANYVAFRLAEWLLALRYHRAVKHHLDRDGLARRLPVIVGSTDDAAGPFLEAVYYPGPSRESAEEAEARMAAAWEVQRRAGLAERERQLWEAADSMRQMRKALRATRFWPSRRVRLLREYYESKEAMLFRVHELDRPHRPSWKIADDAEFEQFLKQYYVDAFLKIELGRQ